MQVPERLALIGGSILLASTLIFTLKSQASSLIPNIGHSISNVYDYIGDAQKSSDFNNGYQQAKQRGWKTGTWGTAPYYIDSQHNMYVGSGELNGVLNLVLGMDTSNQLHSINLEQNVKAPQNSNSLFQANFGNNDTLTAINGLDKLDTSQVTNMESLFTNDRALSNIDISNWDTHNVHNINFIFQNDTSLTNLNVGSLDTSDMDLRYLVFNEDNNLKSLTLGPKFQVRTDMGLSSTYKNGDQTLNASQLQDNNPHPGNWIKQ